MKENTNAVYIFVDESGNFDFSKNGSSHFILTATSTRNPVVSAQTMFKAKYDLLKNGVNAEFFHASEDKRDVRRAFFSEIGSAVECDIDSVVAEKRKAHPTLYMRFDRSECVKIEERFFKTISKQLLRYVIYRHVRLRKKGSVSHVVVVFDKTLPKSKQNAIADALKKDIEFEFGVVSSVYFHTTKSDINSQLSDYCCWAIKRKWVDGELGPYEKIKRLIRSEFDIFMFGDWYYY